jgi:hypothetical protein
LPLHSLDSSSSPFKSDLLLVTRANKGKGKLKPSGRIFKKSNLAGRAELVRCRMLKNYSLRKVVVLRHAKGWQLDYRVRDTYYHSLELVPDYVSIIVGGGNNRGSLSMGAAGLKAWQDICGPWMSRKLTMIRQPMARVT